MPAPATSTHTVPRATQPCGRANELRPPPRNLEKSVVGILPTRGCGALPHYLAVQRRTSARHSRGVIVFARACTWSRLLVQISAGHLSLRNWCEYRAAIRNVHSPSCLAIVLASALSIPNINSYGGKYHPQGEDLQPPTPLLIAVLRLRADAVKAASHPPDLARRLAS